MGAPAVILAVILLVIPPRVTPQDRTVSAGRHTGLELLVIPLTLEQPALRPCTSALRTLKEWHDVTYTQRLRGDSRT